MPFAKEFNTKQTASESPATPKLSYMGIDKKLFLHPIEGSIRDAMAKINQNQCGVVFACEGDTERVLGSVSDGDIRRHLTEGGSVDSDLANCVNKNFVYIQEGTSREVILKHLDHRIRAVPMLDVAGNVQYVFSQHSLPLLAESPILARARAPVRVSFGGGGSDVTHYFSDQNGAVINASITVYSHAVLRKRSDNQIIIKSQDLDDELEAANLSELVDHVGQFGLIVSVLRVIHPKFGFELHLESDFPVGSGLGGSSVVCAVILGCFNEFRQDKWSNHELAEMAFQAERLYLGVSGGWQDQYATVFGGFNFMEFSFDENIIQPISIPGKTLRELEESLVLCGTGDPHDSGNIHEDQKESMQNSAIRSKVEENVRLVYRIRNHLLRGELQKFGACLHESWMLKRQFSSQISNNRIDDIYDGAIRNGALGGKLLGAGGGGYFIFYVAPFSKYQLKRHLLSKGLSVENIHFEFSGLSSWTARETEQ